MHCQKTIWRLAAIAWIAHVGMWASISSATADMQKLGPIPLPIKINKVPLALSANTLVDVNTARGDFNARGDVIISAPAPALAASIVDITKTLLPHDVANDDCNIRIHRVEKLEIVSQSNEIRAKGKLVISLLDCSFRVRVIAWDRENREVEFEIAIQPLASPKKLELKLMRTPEIKLPSSWNGITTFVNVEKKMEALIKDAFSKQPVFKVPAPYGARIAIQGSSVSGDSQIVSFLLRGDAHIDAASTTTVIAQALNQTSGFFDFTVSLKDAPSN
jgi:hypothetical protein